MSAAGGGTPGGGDRSPQRKSPRARLGPPGQHGRLPGLGAGLCMGGARDGVRSCGEQPGGRPGPWVGPSGPSVVPQWSPSGPRWPLAPDAVRLGAAASASRCLIQLRCRVFGASSARRHWAIKTSVYTKFHHLSRIRERFWKQPACVGCGTNRCDVGFVCAVAWLILCHAAPGWCNHMLCHPDRFANVTHEAINVTLRTTLAATTKLVVPTPAKPILPVQTGVQAQQEEQSSGMTIFFSLLVLGE